MRFLNVYSPARSAAVSRNRLFGICEKPLPKGSGIFAIYETMPLFINAVFFTSRIPSYLTTVLIGGMQDFNL